MKKEAGKKKKALAILTDQELAIVAGGKAKVSLQDFHFVVQNGRK